MAQTLKTHDNTENKPQPYKRDYITSLMVRLLRHNGITATFDQRIMQAGDERSVAKKVTEMVSRHNDRMFLGILSVKGARPEHRHSVALMINPTKKIIAYQDPKGTEMPVHLSRFLQEELPDYTIQDHQLKQQTDEVSCAVITVDNLLRTGKGEDLDPSPDVHSLRQEHSGIKVVEQEQSIAIGYIPKKKLFARATLS